MKAIEILDCIIYMGISGEDLQIIDVPSEDDEYTPQTEEWWVNEVGNVPPAPVPSGKYVIFYPQYSWGYLCTDYVTYTPDCEIEDGDKCLYLYKLE